MLRWCIVAVLVGPVGLAGCGHDMSDREYCTRREMGWEMAYPNLTLSDADRSRIVDLCVTNVAWSHENGELERSIQCMNEHLKGHGHAREQYLAFTRCEVVDPSRPR